MNRSRYGRCLEITFPKGYGGSSALGLDKADPEAAVETITEFNEACDPDGSGQINAAVYGRIAGERAVE